MQGFGGWPMGTKLAPPSSVRAQCADGIPFQKEVVCSSSGVVAFKQAVLIVSYRTAMDRLQLCWCALLACSYILLIAASKSDAGTRNAIIDEVVLEAKQHAFLQATNVASMDTSTTRMRFKAFKRAQPDTLAQGNARLLFEDMVSRAEKKILQNRRKTHLSDVQQNKEAVAEALAMELLHTPGSLLSEEEIARFFQESACQDNIPNPDCGDAKSQKHRTANGLCNNLKSPSFGAANVPFTRLIHPQYEDGISKLRGEMQSTGSPLFIGPFSPPNPSPRIISVGVVQDRPILEDTRSHILMQWGQFLDHDLNLAPEIHDDCTSGCKVAGACVPIPVPLDDKTILVTRTDSDSRGCHNFTRSLPACDSTPPHSMTPREQINSITSFIDGSQIYSSNDTLMNMYIRDPESSIGLLKVGPPVQGTTKSSLPLDPVEYTACPDGPPCFLAGDIRVNEQTALIVMHTIWMREHNRIANLLHEINPHWGSDKIFLVTREIVGAELQKITYDEYLPAVLGDGFLEDYVGYIDSVNPTIPNAFATAAYRFGHSQIKPFFDRLDENYEPLPIGQLDLVDTFFDTSKYAESGGTDPILRGLVSKQARKTDEFLNSILTNKLFAANSSVPGLDLASLNIQRGRDHGLPPYLTWKRWAEQECGVISEFNNELTKIYLLQTYGSLETVDLFVGGLAEEPLEGGLVGATFACIFSRTFINLRSGDRFFYKNSDSETAPFTVAQREEIEKVSLSRIICDNSDNIQQIQPNAFFATQGRVECSNTEMIPMMDLNAWREEDLPTACFMKVNVENSRNVQRTRFFLVSGLVSSPTYHYVRQVARGRNSGLCLPFRCPERSGRATKVVLFPSSHQRRTCHKTQNDNLPASYSYYGDEYYQWLNEADISETSGIYTSEESCTSGTTSAVDYSCSRSSVSKDDMLIQSLEEMLVEDKTPDELTEVNKDITAKDPLFEELPKEIKDELLNNDKEKEGPVKKDNNLIGLLENVINELKAQDSSSSHE